MPQMQVYFVGVRFRFSPDSSIFALVIAAMMGTFLDYFVGSCTTYTAELKAQKPWLTIMMHPIKQKTRRKTAGMTPRPRRRRQDQESIPGFVIAGATLVLSTFPRRSAEGF